MNWLDGVLIAFLVAGLILGTRHANIIARLSHFLAVLTVFVFTAATFWFILWILEKIPFLNVVAGFFIVGMGGPIFISITMAIMFYVVLVKLYRNAEIYERIQSAIKWNPPALINRLGSALVTVGIVYIVLAMLLVVIVLFVVGGIFWSCSFSGTNVSAIMTLAGSSLCRSSLSIFGWLFNWTGLIVSIVLLIGYAFLLRRERSIIRSIPAAESRPTSSVIREYYENKMNPAPAPSVDPVINQQSQSSTEAPSTKTSPIAPGPPLPPTTDAAKAQEFFDRAAELESTGNHEKAIEEYTKAVRLDARHTLSYLKRGLLLKHMGMKPAAIADFRRVLDTTEDVELIEKANGHIAELG